MAECNSSVRLSEKAERFDWSTESDGQLNCPVNYIPFVNGWETMGNTSLTAHLKTEITILRMGTQPISADTETNGW